MGKVTLMWRLAPCATTLVESRQTTLELMLKVQMCVRLKKCLMTEWIRMPLAPFGILGPRYETLWTTTLMCMLVYDVLVTPLTILWLASEPSPKNMWVGLLVRVCRTLWLSLCTTSGPSLMGVIFRKWQLLCRPFSDRPWKNRPVLLLTLGRVATSTKLSQSPVAPLPKPLAFKSARWASVTFL